MKLVTVWLCACPDLLQERVAVDSPLAKRISASGQKGSKVDSLLLFQTLKEWNTADADTVGQVQNEEIPNI